MLGVEGRDNAFGGSERASCCAEVGYSDEVRIGQSARRLSRWDGRREEKQQRSAMVDAAGGLEADDRRRKRTRGFVISALMW